MTTFEATKKSSDTFALPMRTRTRRKRHLPKVLGGGGKMSRQPQILIVSENEAQYHAFRNLLSDSEENVGIIRPDNIGEACNIIRSSGVDALLMEPGALLSAAAIRPKEERASTRPNVKLDLAYVRSYIYRHFQEKIRLEELASLISVTPNYLCFMFRKREGMTLKEFVEKLRVERAAALLRGTERTVKSVAKLVGFSTPSYFCERFRHYYGMSPLDYRKASQKININVWKERR